MSNELLFMIFHNRTYNFIQGDAKTFVVKVNLCSVLFVQKIASHITYYEPCLKTGNPSWITKYYLLDPFAPEADKESWNR